MKYVNMHGLWSTYWRCFASCVPECTSREGAAATVFFLFSFWTKLQQYSSDRLVQLLYEYPWSTSWVRVVTSASSAKREKETKQKMYTYELRIREQRNNTCEYLQAYKIKDRPWTTTYNKEQNPTRITSIINQSHHKPGRVVEAADERAGGWQAREYAKPRCRPVPPSFYWSRAESKHGAQSRRTARTHRGEKRAARVRK